MSARNTIDERDALFDEIWLNKYRCVCSDCLRERQDQLEFEEYLSKAGPSDFMQLGQPPCECGKEKHGFASHSRWCAAFSEE